MRLTGRTLPVICLIGTALLWSTGGLLIKWVDWNPMAIAGSRSLIAIIVFLAFFGKPKFTGSKYQILGALSYSATVILFVCGNKLTTAANVILLQYSAPVYVALLSWVIVGEKIMWKDWLTIVLTLCGMALFFFEKLAPGNFVGNLFGAVSGFTFAFMILCLRKQKDTSPVESVILGNLLTFIVSLPFIIGPMPPVKSLIGIGLLGVFQLGLAYVLFTKAIRQVTALEGILIPVLEPLLNPIWVFLALGERPGTWALIGGTVILLSITFRYAGEAIGKKA